MGDGVEAGGFLGHSVRTNQDFQVAPSVAVVLSKEGTRYQARFRSLRSCSDFHRIVLKRGTPDLGWPLVMTDWV